MMLHQIAWIKKFSAVGEPFNTSWRKPMRDMLRNDHAAPDRVYHILFSEFLDRVIYKPYPLKKTWTKQGYHRFTIGLCCLLYKLTPVNLFFFLSEKKKQKTIWKRKKKKQKKQKKCKKIAWKKKAKKRKKQVIGKKTCQKRRFEKAKKTKKIKNKQVKTQESNEVTMERGLHTQLDPTFPEGGPTPSLTLPRDLGWGVQPPGWPYPGTWLGGSWEEAGSKIAFFFCFFLGKKRKKSKKKAKKKRFGPPSFQPPSPPSRMEQPNLQSFPQT